DLALNRAQHRAASPGKPEAASTAAKPDHTYSRSRYSVSSTSNTVHHFDGLLAPLIVVTEKDAFVIPEHGDSGVPYARLVGGCSIGQLLDGPEREPGAGLPGQGITAAKARIDLDDL